MNHLIIRTHWIGMPAKLSLDSMEMMSKELFPELRKINVSPVLE